MIQHSIFGDDLEIKVPVEQVSQSKRDMTKYVIGIAPLIRQILLDGPMTMAEMIEEIAECYEQDRIVTNQILIPALQFMMKFGEVDHIGLKLYRITEVGQERASREFDEIEMVRNWLRGGE